MRAVKYRIWDRKTKKMFSVAEVSTNTDDFDFNKAEVIGQVYEKKYEDWETKTIKGGIWLEFTGLYDVKGKEIYEGDILQGSFGAGQVIWSDGGFSLTSKKNNLLYIYNPLSQYSRGQKKNHLQFLRIIGNIYENPNLLKQQNENADKKVTHRQKPCGLMGDTICGGFNKGDVVTCSDDTKITCSECRKGMRKKNV
jgi:hypothetical protein